MLLTFIIDVMHINSTKTNVYSSYNASSKNICG